MQMAMYFIKNELLSYIRRTARHSVWGLDHPVTRRNLKLEKRTALTASIVTGKFTKPIIKHSSDKTSYNFKKLGGITHFYCFLTVVFVIVWTPYAVVSFWTAFGDASKVSRIAASSAAVFAKTSSMWNPIIYTFLNPRFRSALYKMWCTRGNRVQPTEPDNQTEVIGNIISHYDILLVDSESK